ncbi:fumarate hydratase [Sulfodiicoccus acidiphilus]|uniref:fumarate hydratase n=1 Tax=Sulfodiicoccus acidiphilus TaxID=1670455 RepID=A0A348B448_9CREN|nr:class II fumarate hydratase [Sulfodiicoccus acidiphilus]BBD72950.1 fumarate hydratase [Sulfodiicoccus acidiphilus]GGT87782.1 fumarate hydratase [Sulfodiicoccus acidiphilus]
MSYVEAAKKLFMNTGTRFPRRLIWAMGAVKYAAADFNTSIGLLDSKLGMAIMDAANEVMQGKHDEEVVLDVFQTGSGTGLNMNINEVIAARASQLAGVKVHPNDHVNMGQSSNDTVPTAIRVAAYAEVRESLLPALDQAIGSLRSLAERTSSIVKSGRTHLRDALPVTMGQEFGAYEDALSHQRRALESSLEYVAELPIGGTAVGTGLNTPPNFGDEVVSRLAKLTGYPLKKGNSFRAMRLLTDMVNLSAVMRGISLDLYRIGQDVRLMFSGPYTGLNEIDIPSQEEVAGSSIMPGKTNPVTVESTLLVCAQVIGLDHANQFVGMLGEFELSMGVPLMGYNVVSQASLLSEALRKFSSLVLDKIVPNREKALRYAESSASLITVVSPLIGYDRASALGKRIAKGMSIREALRDMGMSEQEINKVLDVSRLTKGGLPTKE